MWWEGECTFYKRAECLLIDLFTLAFLGLNYGFITHAVNGHQTNLNNGQSPIVNHLSWDHLFQGRGSWSGVKVGQIIPDLENNLA
jgi:hypothetical protein